jgi:ribosomal protein L29
MDNIGKHLTWNLIRTKMEKGEKIEPADIVWAIILNGGKANKDAFTGNENVEKIDGAIKKFEETTKKTDAELRVQYDETKKEHIKSMDEQKTFFSSLQEKFKEVKTQINKGKIDSDIKEASISLMREYLEMLNREIISGEKFPDYDEWKKDKLSVASTQIGYLKQRIKNTKKDVAQNLKTWDKTEKAFPIPECMKEKQDGVS